jgi:hypothetical protein
MTTSFFPRRFVCSAGSTTTSSPCSIPGSFPRFAPSTDGCSTSVTRFQSSGRSRSSSSKIATTGPTTRPTRSSSEDRTGSTTGIRQTCGRRRVVSASWSARTSDISTSAPTSSDRHRFTTSRSNWTCPISRRSTTTAATRRLPITHTSTRCRLRGIGRRSSRIHATSSRRKFSGRSPLALNTGTSPSLSERTHPSPSPLNWSKTIVRRKLLSQNRSRYRSFEQEVKQLISPWRLD